MQIIRRSLFDSACKIRTGTVFNPANEEHLSLLSSGLAFLNPLPPHIQNANNERRLIVLTSKGEEVTRLDDV